jgi:hypothetical protein
MRALINSRARHFCVRPHSPILARDLSTVNTFPPPTQAVPTLSQLDISISARACIALQSPRRLDWSSQAVRLRVDWWVGQTRRRDLWDAIHPGQRATLHHRIAQLRKLSTEISSTNGGTAASARCGRRSRGAGHRRSSSSRRALCHVDVGEAAQHGCEAVPRRCCCLQDRTCVSPWGGCVCTRSRENHSRKRRGWCDSSEPC